MKKRLFLIGGLVFIIAVIVAVVWFFAILFGSVKTPALTNVSAVYLEFVEADALWGGGDSAEYTRREITDEADKDYLIDLFGKGYELYNYKCGCPCDNIRVVFKTILGDRTFGVGVTGDGNMIYHNAFDEYKYFGVSFEEYDELMTFFSKFEETADYEYNLTVD